MKKHLVSFSLVIILVLSVMPIIAYTDQSKSNCCNSHFSVNLSSNNSENFNFFNGTVEEYLACINANTRGVCPISGCGKQTILDSYSNPIVYKTRHLLCFYNFYYVYFSWVCSDGHRSGAYTGAYHYAHSLCGQGPGLVL